jgi:hypothetical protein
MLFLARSLMGYFVVFELQGIELYGFFMTLPPLTSNIKKEVSQHGNWNCKMVQ